MFCHARVRKRSLITWQAIASPSADHFTSARWWKKTPTACRKAPTSAYGNRVRLGAGCDEHEVRRESDGDAREDPPGDHRRQRVPAAHLGQLQDDVQDRAR